MIETVRLSQKGKSQLTQLKRKTGIDQWNTLCRWAFCLSLAESSVPPKEEIATDSNVEMSWKTFAGQYDLVYEALLKQRLIEDKLPMEESLLWFRVHLHRGISYLSKSTNSIDHLAEMITSMPRHENLDVSL